MSTHIGIGQCRWHDGYARCNCHRDNYFGEKFPYTEIHHRLHDNQTDEESYGSYNKQYIKIVSGLAPAFSAKYPAGKVAKSESPTTI